MQPAFVSAASTFVRHFSRNTVATCRRPHFSSPLFACVTPRMSADCGNQEPYTNRSMSTSEEDSVMTAVEQKIAEALAPTRLSVIPTYGDPKGSHVTITVVSDKFKDLNMVKRHQAVYKVIWEELQVRLLTH